MCFMICASGEDSDQLANSRNLDCFRWALWIVKDPMLLMAVSEDSDQSAGMSWTDLNPRWTSRHENMPI